MIYRNSYETTLGSLFNIKDIVKSLKQLLIDKEYIDVSNTASVNNIQPFYLTGKTSLEDRVDIFNHSIYIDDVGDKFLFTDLRLYVKFDRNNDEILINNKNEYNFALNRSKMDLIWNAEDYDSIKVRLDFAALVYATLISDVVSNAFSLGFQDRSFINIAAIVFYHSLFTNDFNEEYKQLLAHKILINNKNVKSDDVFRIIDSLDGVVSIEQFSNKLKDIIESSRLNDFNLAVLLTLLKHSWYGINAKDYIAVALEYPPTWVSLLYIILSEKSYKKTPIAKIGELLGKRGKKEIFLKEFEQLTDELTIAVESLTDLDFEPI